MDILPADQEIYLVGGAVRDFCFPAPHPTLILLCLRMAFPSPEQLPTPSTQIFFHWTKNATQGGLSSPMNLARASFSISQSIVARTLTEDLRARDFTINAIAYNLRDETIIDPTEGGKDLRAKTHPRLFAYIFIR